MATPKWADKPGLIHAPHAPIRDVVAFPVGLVLREFRSASPIVNGLLGWVRLGIFNLEANYVART